MLREQGYQARTLASSHLCLPYLSEGSWRHVSSNVTVLILHLTNDMGLILWVLHFFLDVLQACGLQDLPAVARYVVLSVAAVAVLALAFYALAPPTILQYCEQAQDEARSLLAHASASPGFRSGHSPGASDADDVQYNPLSAITSRRVSY